MGRPKSNNKTRFTPKQMATTVCWYVQTKSPTQVQQLYRKKFGKNGRMHAEKLPTGKSMRDWLEKFLETGSVNHRTKRDRVK